MTAQRTALANPLAPWAEVVPNMPPMTTDELHAIPDDGWAYELVEGVLVRMPLSSFGASNVGYRLGGRLSVYVEDNGLGVVTGEQGGYCFDPAHPLTTELAPDVAFVRADRLPSPMSPDYYKRAPQLAPDLAVEVASENQFAPGMEAKARTYLTLGTRLVWVIWPRYKRVDVWHPGAETPTPRGVDDTLDGEDVVPGFTYQIARLFPYLSILFGPRQDVYSRYHRSRRLAFGRASCRLCRPLRTPRSSRSAHRVAIVLGYDSQTPANRHVH